VVGRPQGVFGVFSYYHLVISSFNIVPLIMEFTVNCNEIYSYFDRNNDY
jgi:hypothetical protein